MTEPKIKYDIEAAVKGQADIEDLAQQLEDMGKVLGSDLSPAAKSAAADMRALGQQQSAIVAFAKLSEQVKASERDLALAQRSAKSFVTEISASGPPTAQQAETLQRLNAQVVSSETKLTGQKQALSGANQELLKYGLTGDRLIEGQRQTAASVDALKASVQASIPAFKAAGTEGASSARQIQDAWSTLGVKSFGQTQTEIAKVKAALETVKATSKSPLEIKIATEAAQAQIKQLEGGVAKVGTTTSGVSGLLRQLGPLMATAFSAQQFVGTIVAAESLNRSFEQIFGSTAKARAEMEFISKTSNRLGLETLDLARSYQSLSASTKGTVLEGQATRDVFEAVSRAMSTLGKSSAETDRALTAVSQIASKGTASMEELRGQLGEALPGAMKAAADGAGLTVEQLVEMVSSGSVLAQDILPALTKGLNELYSKAAPPETVIAEWARFKNVMTETSVLVGESGASKVIAKGLSGLGTAAQYAVADVDILLAMLGDLGVAMVRGSTEVNTSNDVLESYKVKLGLTAEAVDKTAAAQADLATAQGETNAATQESGQHLDDLAKKQAAAGESVLAVRQRYSELAKGSAAYIAQIEKEVAARTAESAVVTQLVNIYGTEVEKRQAAVSVAQDQAAMAEKLAAARNTESIIAASYVIKLQEQAIATGDVTEATKKQIAEAQKSAAAKQTELERTDALAKSKRLEAEASKAQAQALQDNSTRVGEYRAAVEAAAREVARLTELQTQGRATDQQVTDSKAKLAAATLLYRDALADASKAAELNIAAQQRAGQLAQANIGVDIERAKAALEVASALGDSAKATQLSTQLSNLQVQASQAQADAARNEAAAIRESADTKERELKARGELTAAAKAEIEARRQAANMKDLEAEKSDILTNKILALAKANGTEAASLDAKNAALERTLSAQEKANSLAERAIALENKRRGVDAEGFSTDKSGNRIVAGGDLNTLTGIAAFLKSAGVADDAKARNIAREFADSRGNVQYFDNPGQMKYGGAGSTISQALLKAAERYTFGIGGDGSGGSSGAQQPSTIPNPSAATVNVRITLPNGTTQTVPTTQEGSQALIAALQAAKLSAGA